MEFSRGGGSNQLRLLAMVMAKKLVPIAINPNRIPTMPMMMPVEAFDEVDSRSVSSS